MTRRHQVEQWFRAALEAVEPRRLVAEALDGEEGPATVIAIGKAAGAMCWGAVDALGHVTGLCVTGHETSVPADVELIIGNHPIPGEASLVGGARVLSLAPEADIALISGGGSAMCESPIEGVPLDFLARATAALLTGGASIEQLNLVRGHLSKVKGGGLGPIATYVLSDVSGQPPDVVSSGPTIPRPHEPDAALDLLREFGVHVPHDIEVAVRSTRPPSQVRPRVVVVGDGRTAAAAALAASGLDGNIEEGWITGSLAAELDDFIGGAAPGLTVAAGEPVLEALGMGVGGRNTHAALLAAQRIEGTDWVFGALATDGVDGSSTAAGAIVDGTTITRGGDPGKAVATFDSATYLGTVGDLIQTGPTGTNVADVWLIWKN